MFRTMRKIRYDCSTSPRAIVDEIQNRDIQSIAVPPLGCGLGGLNWGKVRPKIEDYLAQLSHVQIVIFEPKGAPEAVKMTHIKEAPR
jgi:O-acetyl-ADP-ribose deacetylase (regulator of RNase III)